LTQPGHHDRTDVERDGAAQVLAATRAAHRYAQRRRLGLPGTEPSEVRRPLWRGYAAEGLGVVALLLSGLTSAQAAAAVALAALVVGAPKAWVWGHDRLSGFSWGLAAALLVAGEVAYMSGGRAARVSLASKGHAGAAGLLIAACAVVALVGFFRRWGTRGNVFYTGSQLRKGDPRAVRAVTAGAEREGWRHPDPGGGGHGG
jgi:hypothetical protein